MIVKPFDRTLKTYLKITPSWFRICIITTRTNKEINFGFRLIQCGSKSLNDTQRNYAITIELECLAIYLAIKKCKFYLYGKEYVVCVLIFVVASTVPSLAYSYACSFPFIPIWAFIQVRCTTFACIKCLLSVFLSFGPYNCLILGLAWQPGSLKRILWIIPGYPRVHADALLIPVLLLVQLGIWRPPPLGLCSVCLVLCLSHLV